VEEINIPRAKNDDKEIDQITNSPTNPTDFPESQPRYRDTPKKYDFFFFVVFWKECPVPKKKKKKKNKEEREAGLATVGLGLLGIGATEIECAIATAAPTGDPFERSLAIANSAALPIGVNPTRFDGQQDGAGQEQERCRHRFTRPG
jgi:hypothetical protein